MKVILFWVAVTGWTLALAVHILTLANFDVEEASPYVWVLHIGIFIVWLPAILQLRKRLGLSHFGDGPAKKRVNPGTFLKAISDKAPAWLIVVAAAGFVYSFLNFSDLMTDQGGMPAVKSGHYYLESHGHWIRDITEQEYHHNKASTVRTFSRIWIVFYGLAAMVLYPFKTKNEAE